MLLDKAVHVPEPLATYRIQFHPGFGFDDAAAIPGYLADLGVSHLYASPYLQSELGSTHGYHVVNPHRISEELGGVEAHTRLCQALLSHSLGQILDIVPNHMSIATPLYPLLVRGEERGVSPRTNGDGPPVSPLGKGGHYNAWWWDVLENGPASRYASYFDIYRDLRSLPHKGGGQGDKRGISLCQRGVGDSPWKILLPILGDHYGRALEAGELRLEREGTTFTVRYYGHIFPVEPRSLRGLLATAAARCGSNRLAFMAYSFGHLVTPTSFPLPSWERSEVRPTPSRSPRSQPSPFQGEGERAFTTYVVPSEAKNLEGECLVPRRHRDKEVLYTLLAELCEKEPEVAAALNAVVAEVNADPDALDTLLQSQNYRLAYWRTARHELGYRCFFGLNHLIALRVEDAQVFTDTHRLILNWLEKNVLQGLRIDHIDGLLDPEEYLQRLHRAAPKAWTVVEKILMPDERLRASWPVAGTTGYDFLNLVSGLFVDPAGEKPLTQLYSDFTGQPTDYHAIVREKKYLVMREVLASDISRLTTLFLDVCQRHRRYRDYILQEVREVLQETIACFPAYRAYVRAGVGQVTQEDIRCVTRAIEEGKTNRPDLDADLFDFLRDILLLRPPLNPPLGEGGLSGGSSRHQGGAPGGEAEVELAMRFQQVTGPAMAKGAEDTAFYCFNRLAALNEVGGDPGKFGVSVAELHRRCAETQRRWPRTMLTTSTHDTKRSEDVRARISLLSEIPVQWGDTVRRWSRINEKHRRGDLPDRNAEYLLYQTLVGAWPLPVERALAYMEKATREAKAYTSWTDQNPGYEKALRGFIQGILSHEEFVHDLVSFVGPLVEPGRINSMAQTLIKLTAPGVPDIYQGTELWDLSLVDPDNRRPVDYELRRRLLAELKSATPEEIWRRAEEGLPKLWVIRQALHLRRRHPALFGPDGEYRPIYPRGEKAAHVVAFARGERAVTVVPRLVIGLGNSWGDTTMELPDGLWQNELTGDQIRGAEIHLAELLNRFPVALLSRGESGP